jgi:L-fuconolactonase
LHRTCREHGVRAVRAIHTVSYYDYDNSYLAAITPLNPDWVAGVCCLDPDQIGSPAELRRLLADRQVRSLRSIPSRQRGSFADPSVYRLWDICADAGATVDLFLMDPDLIPGAEALLRRYPAVPVALDHCMDLKPGPRYGEVLAQVLCLSAYPNLLAKVDFISTGTAVGYPGDDLADAAMQIIGAYGAERCVWGSNFPNALWTPKMSYAEHLRLFTECLPLPPAARRLILGETARRLWFPWLDPADCALEVPARE